MVTLASWFAIAAGAAFTIVGIILLAMIFSGRSIPVSGAGLFVVMTMLAGPLLTLAGLTIMAAGYHLRGGTAWAHKVLEIFSWIALCGSIGWVGYSASQERHIHAYHVVQGAIFLLLTGAPAVLMLLLLRSDSIQRTLSR